MSLKKAFTASFVLFVILFMPNAVKCESRDLKLSRFVQPPPDKKPVSPRVEHYKRTIESIAFVLCLKHVNLLSRSYLALNLIENDL